MNRKIVFVLSLFILLLSFQFARFSEVEVKASDGFRVHNIVTGLSYATIQEAIDAPETLGGHVIFAENGTYYENLVVNKGVAIIGENRNATVIEGSDAGTVIDVFSDNVTISNFSVLHSSSMSGFSGIAVFALKNVTIEKNDIRDSNVSIAIGYSQDVRVESNTVSNSYGGIVIEHSKNIAVTGNYASNNSWGISLYSSQDCRLQNNTMAGNLYNVGVNGESLSDFTNYVDPSNTVNGRPVYYLFNQSHLVIDSLMYPNLGYLALVNSTDVVIRNLNVEENLSGFLLVNTNNSQISRVRASRNYGGIVVYSCFNVTVESSVISENTESGIYQGYSENIKIISNEVTNKSRQRWSNGIESHYSKNSTITANDVSNNKYGVFLYYSSGNVIHHNNFVDNTYQAGIYSSQSNVWDDGYPSGGNYWSDYNWTDLYSGANQNLVGSDGIGDTVYTIDANNYDRYPLTAPTHAYISVPYYRQLRSYYCGPAALQMVFDFYGPVIPQSEIADAARTASDGTYTPDMVRASHFSNLSTSVGREMPTNITGYTARKLGYAAFEYGGMAIHQLKSLVARGYPIIVLITWHFIVAVGYDSSHITFQDSLNGPKYNMTYQDFDMEWDYSGHWALVVSPWKIDVILPQSVEQSNVFNVTASITYPLPPPFYPGQYNVANASATIALPPGLTLVSGENTRKSIDTGVLAAGTSVNVTWTVRGGSVGAHMVSVEAEGIVAGLVPGLPSYPEPYNYEDRIGGQGQGVITVNQGPDGTPPTTLDDCNGLWHTTDFTVTLNASDDASGVADTYYKINDGPTKTVSADGQPFITTEGTNNKLEYWSTDNAGNEELPHKIITEIKLDKTAPAGSITINNGTAYTTSTSVTLTLTATDSTSGVYQIRFSNDGVWETEPWQTPSTTKTWALTSGDEAKTVYYQVKDNAGLASETYLDTITLDETAPTIEIPTREPASDVQPDQSVKVSVNVTDAASHVKNATLYYSLNNGTTWEEPIFMNLNGITNLYEATIPGQPASTWVKYKIVASDYAGNNATLDRTEPYSVYQVIPEFPSSLILPLVMALTTLVAIFAKKKATMEYARTKDVLHAMQMLGHKKIETTLKYTQLIAFSADEYHCKVAKSLDEAVHLVEDGFEFVTDLDGCKLFRKRK